MTVNNQPVSTIAKRYTILDKLGAGGVGTVYRVLDRLTGSEVALKQLALNTSLNSRVDLSKNIALTTEFQLLSALRHPNLIGVLNYGFEKTERGLQPFFTMALVEGGRTLREASRNRSLQDKLMLLRQVLHALVYIHRQGIVHRDLKPENILVTPDDQVKVLDFGLAALQGQQLELEVVGTVYYMAPETFLGLSPTRATDLYAVGVMAYEMLVGEHPYGGDSVFKLLHNLRTTEPEFSRLDSLVQEIAAVRGNEAQHGDTTEPVFESTNDASTILLNRPLDAYQEHLLKSEAILNPQTLGAVIRKLMAKNPQHRYQDAEIVLRDLDQIFPGMSDNRIPQVRDSFLHAARFVGRQRELHQLTEALDQAASGSGSCWLIGGESGVGKTRLLDELRTHALIRGALVLRGQAEADGVDPYQLWREPLRRLLLMIEPDALSPLNLSVLKQIAPDLDQLTQLKTMPAEPLQGVDSEQRLHTAVGDLVKAFFRENLQPLLIILEDVQWATKALDLITVLTTTIGALPLVLVASFRTDEAPDLPAKFPHARALALERLSEAEISLLSEAMLGEAGRSQRVVRLLQQESEGNVFFMTEIIQTLIEEVADLSKLEHKQTSARFLTGGIQQIMQRRLERVPAAFRPLLNLAAINGRQLDLRLLTHLAAGLDVETWITACANAAVLVMRDERWWFTHDKLREYVLHSLPSEDLTALHEQVGQALETVHADDLEQHAAALAYHWSFTANQAKKVRYSILAGESAMKISAFADGQTHFQNALDALGSTLNMQAERAAILTRLGDIAITFGKYDDAMVRLEDAMTVARSVGEPKALAKALQTFAWVHLRRGAMDKGKTLLDESLAAARQGGHQPEIMLALYLTAVLHVIQGEYAEAKRAANEALPLAETLADRAHEADIHNVLGAVEEGLGNLQASQIHLNTAYTVAKAIGYRYLMANAQGNMARNDYFQGSYAESLRQAEEVIQIFREIGSVYSEAIMLYLMGFNRIALKQPAAAWTDLLTSLKLSQQMGANPLILITLTGVVRLYRDTNQREQAAELLSFIIHHPDSTHDVDVLREAEALRTDLEGEAQAWERGKSLALDSVVASLLAQHA